MSVKTVMAVIVAALVAGVVLGSFGIAGAGTNNQAAAPGAMAPVPAGMADQCGDCSQEAAAASGDCGDCSTSEAAATAPKGGCPDGSGAASGGCPSGSADAACDSCP